MPRRSGSSSSRPIGSCGGTRQIRTTTVRANGPRFCWGDLLVLFPGRARPQQCAGIRLMADVMGQPPKASESTLASSAAFGTFVIVFAIAAPVIYVARELGGFPLF